MQLHIMLKVVGLAGAALFAFVLLRLFGVKPLELLDRTGQAADAAAADVREVVKGNRHTELAKEINKKSVNESTATPSDKPLTDDDVMQRELAAERQRFLKARQDALNEAREKVLKGEFEDHKRKREKNARGTGEQ